MSNDNQRRAAPLPDSIVARLPTSGKGSTISCRMAGQTATLMLYGEIGWEVTAAGVTQALLQVGNIDTLDIRIASLGGDVYEGWAIYNVLARNSAPNKRVTIEGMAASMASVIAMVGTEIVMPANSYMMIHNPAGVCFGGGEDMRLMGDLLDHMRGVAAQTYADRTGQPVAVVQAMMDAETYMSADQAASLGFADTVEEPVRMAAKLDVAKLTTMPAQMRAALTKEFQMADKSNTPAVEPGVVQPAVAPVVVPVETPATTEPGAMPSDAPAERQPNPAGSPGFDAVAVAEACQTAGFPQLTARLLRAQANMAAVNADIARAKDIQTAAKAGGKPTMAGAAIAGGVDIETFRTLVFEANASGQVAIDTAVPQRTVQAQAQGKVATAEDLSPSAIYAKKNAPAAHASRRTH